MRACADTNSRMRNAHSHADTYAHADFDSASAFILDTRRKFCSLQESQSKKRSANTAVHLEENYGPHQGAIALYNAQRRYTLLSTAYGVYTMCCTAYDVHSPAYAVRHIVYTVQCTLYTVRCTVYSVHNTVYKVSDTYVSVLSDFTSGTILGVLPYMAA